MARTVASRVGLGRERRYAGASCNDAEPHVWHAMTESWEEGPQPAPSEVRAARRARARRRRDRQRRRLALAVCVAVLAVVAILALSGSGSKPSRSAPARPSGRAPTHALQAIRAVAVGTLSAPVQFPAAASIAGGRVVLLGGLDGSGASTAAVTTLSGGRSAQGGALPVAQHDAQAATLANAVYVFGGGAVQSYDHIMRFDPGTGQVTQAGHLPQPASDVAVASVGDTAYVIGGYNGTSALDPIVAWSPGAPARVGSRLRTALRSPAAASVDGRVIIAGGSQTASASDAILSFDPATRAVVQIGHLPAPLTHATAATLSSTVYVVGGRGATTDSQTATVLAIHPSNRLARRGGRL